MVEVFTALSLLIEVIATTFGVSILLLFSAVIIWGIKPESSEKLFSRLSDRVGLQIFTVKTLVFFPILFLAVGRFALQDVSADNLRMFLSAAIAAQSTILTIIFSITILNVQLTVPKYSPRIVEGIIRSRTLIITFAIYITSIFFDSYLLLIVGGVPYHTAAIFVGAGIFFATFIVLLDFMQHGFEKTSPEGILRMFEEDISFEDYREYTRGGSEDDVNPLYPLRSMFMSSLAENERATAEQTLNTYKRISRRLVFEYAGACRLKDDFELKNDDFNEILNDHLQDMAFKAEEEGESQLVSDIVSHQRELGELESVFNDDLLIRQSNLALSGNLTHSKPEKGDYYVWSASWKQLSELMLYSSEKKSLPNFEGIMLTIKNRSTEDLSHTELPIRRTGHVFTNLFTKMKLSQFNYLETHGDRLKGFDFDWENEFPEDANEPEYLRNFERFLEALKSISTNTVDRFLETGEFPITEGNFKKGWRKICIDACNKAPRKYSKYVLKLHIELAFVSIYEGEDDRVWWVRQFAEIINNGEEEIVNEAFEEMMDYEEVNEYPEVRIIGNEDYDESNFCWTGLRNLDKPLNGCEDFRVKLGNLLNDSKTRARELR